MKTVRIIKLGMLGLAAALLSGCVMETGSYMIEGSRDHALTLVMEQPYFWSDKVNLQIVVARMPDCQRRHNMEPASLPDAEVSLYQVTPTEYQVQQAGNWYVANTEGCTLQSLDEEPKAPGKLMGSFIRKSGRLEFSTTK